MWFWQMQIDKQLVEWYGDVVLVWFSTENISGDVVFEIYLQQDKDFSSNWCCSALAVETLNKQELTMETETLQTTNLSCWLLIMTSRILILLLVVSCHKIMRWWHHLCPDPDLRIGSIYLRLHLLQEHGRAVIKRQKLTHYPQWWWWIWWWWWWCMIYDIWDMMYDVW